MKIVAFHTVKGGQGCTTVAVAFAALNASEGKKVMIFSAAPADDLPGVMGFGHTPSKRVTDNLYYASTETYTEKGIIASSTMHDLDLLVIDGGTSVPDIYGTDKTILVTQQCYLALRRITLNSDRVSGFDGVVVLTDESRAVGLDDLRSIVPLDIVGTVEMNPSVARAVDAGLLVQRIPKRYMHFEDF